ncbi:hypothetical protein ACSBR1_025730 [Camellia fascicularis]
MAAQAVSRMAGAEANPLFFLLDKDGLITMERKGVDPAAAPFAKAPGEIEDLGLRKGAILVKVVKKDKPHVLLGLSGVGGVFDEQMGSPLTECTAVDAFNHAGENISFCNREPFKNVDLRNEKVGHVNQANNMHLFPGIGMRALLSGARLISDGMSQAASECLASYITDKEIQSGTLYPPTRRAVNGSDLTRIRSDNPNPFTKNPIR